VRVYGEGGGGVGLVCAYCAVDTRRYNDETYGLGNYAAADATFLPPALTGGATSVAFVDFYGVWVTTQLDAAAKDPTVPLNFTNHEHGHEEVCVQQVLQAAQGAPVITLVDDVGGFVHGAGLSAWPTHHLSAPSSQFQNGNSMACTDEYHAPAGVMIPTLCAIAGVDYYWSCDGVYCGYHQVGG
jgi:hypothetical protein